MKKYIALYLIALCYSSFATELSEMLKSSTAGDFFEQKENLEWTLDDKLAESDFTWSLYDWLDNKIATGLHKIDSSKKISLVSLNLPRGYYYIKVDGIKGRKTFAITHNYETRKPNKDSFFAFDSAQSWLARENPKNVHQPKNSFEIVSEVAKKAGCECVRERMSWNQCENKKGEFNWLQYKKNAELLSERNIQILGMYHDSPLWSRNLYRTQAISLEDTYNFAKKVSQEFKGKMIAWEYWNEEDIKFSTEPAWEYAAHMKAAYLGFKAGNPDVPVLIGSLCKPLKKYANSIMENGLIDYMDIFNYHIYNVIEKYPEVVNSIRKYAKHHGFENRPIWITENGTRIEGSGKSNTYMKSIKAHDCDQEKLMAEHIVKQCIIMQSLGIDRNFVFVLPPYNENGGTKDWGAMRRDFSVKPQLVAFSNLTYILSSAKLLGEMDFGSDIIAFLYEQSDGSQTLALWKKSEIETQKTQSPSVKFKLLDEKEISISLKNTVKKEYFGLDIMGKDLKYLPDGKTLKVKVSNLVQYINGLDSLKADKLFVKEKRDYAKERSEIDRTLVLNLKLGKSFDLQSDKSLCFHKGENGSAILELYNFSDKKKEGKILCMGAKVNGLPEFFTIAPFSKLSFNIDILNPSQKLSFCGEFDGKKISPLVASIFSMKNFEDFEKVSLKSIFDKKNWRSNCLGKTKISFDDKEKAIRFDVEFNENVDQWAYPIFNITKDFIDLTKLEYVVVDAKIALDSYKIASSNFMIECKGLSEDRSRNIIYSGKIPSKNWSKSFFEIATQDSDKITDVKNIKFGMNIKNGTRKFTFWVRDITFFVRK